MSIRIISSLRRSNQVSKKIILSRQLSILSSLQPHHVVSNSNPNSLSFKHNHLNECCNHNNHKHAFSNASNSPPIVEIATADATEEDEEKDNSFGASSGARLVVSPEVSIRYMKSKAYRDAYAHYKVWELFRRNFGGQWSPLTLRPTCLNEQGEIRTSNPCPICRDEYLTLHHTNIALLQQFISPFTGDIVPVTITGLCHMQYENLLVEIRKAYDYGLISFQVPFREYDYKLYYPDHFNKN